VTVRIGAAFSIAQNAEMFSVRLPNPDSPVATEQGTTQSPNRLTTLSNVVSSFDTELKAFSKTFYLLELKIRNQVVNKVLNELTRNSENNLRTLFVEVESVRAALIKLSLQISDSLERMVQEFKAGVGKTERPKKDTLQFVLAFILDLQKLFHNLKEYGRLFVMVYKEFRRLEMARLQNTKLAFETFGKIMTEHFGDSFAHHFTETPKHLKNMIEEDLLKATFEPAHMFLETDLRMVVNQTNSQIFDEAALDRFWSQINVQETVDAFMAGFVVRKYTGTAIMTKQVIENDFWIFLSVDLFYVAFEVGKQGGSPMLFSVPAEAVQLKTEFGKDSISFYFEEKGLIWNTKKKLSFIVTEGNVGQMKSDHRRVWELLTDAKSDMSRIDSSLQVDKQPTGSEIDGLDLKTGSQEARLTPGYRRPTEPDLSHMSQVDSFVHFPDLKPTQSEVIKGFDGEKETAKTMRGTTID
jgi:hypothetical protein